MAAYWMVPFLHDLPGYIGVCIVVAFFGAILLSASKILQWALPRRWTRLLPIAGSCVMASFFVTGTLGNLSRFIAAFDSLPSLRTIAALITVVFVVTSLIVALKANVTSLRKKQTAQR